MKKLILAIALSLAVVSCDMLSEGSNGRDNRMKEESVGLVWNYLVSPAYTLKYLLLVDRYLLASEEEKDSEVYKDVREALYKGDGGSFLIKGLGVLETGGGSLHEHGVKWIIEYRNNYYLFPEYYLFTQDITGWSFECVSDDLWSAVATDENVTALNFDSEGNCTVSAFGERKTADGYDCSFKTEGEFRVVNIGYDRNFDKVGISGKFFHSVGRGSSVIESCEAVFKGGSNPTEFNLQK